MSIKQEGCNQGLILTIEEKKGVSQMANLELTPMDVERAILQQELALTGYKEGNLTADEAMIFFENATDPDTVIANRETGTGAHFSPLENVVTAASNARGL